MKITKRQLRRIISEAIDKEPFDITKIEPGVSERIGYDYTVTERRPSLFQGIGGQPMERVAFEYRISPDDDTIVDGSLPAVPKGMPLKDFFEAGLNAGFPDMYPPIPSQNVATGTAKGMPRVDGWEKMLPEGKMKITKRQLRRIIKEEKAKLLKEQRATAMGHTAKGDELFDARDNLLGLIEMLDPDEAGFFIEDLVQELQMLQRQM